MGNKLINYVVFQAGWLACVWGAGAGFPWLGPWVVAGAVTVHLVQARVPRLEAGLLAVCAVIGLVFDSLLLWTGWVSYPNGEWIPGLAPYWMIALWVLFGTTLNLSMGWLRRRTWMAALLGMVGGPLSYLAGQGLGAMTLVWPAESMAALAAGWGLVMPMLFSLASRLDGFIEKPRPDFIHTDWRNERASGHA